jgi:hypothetical protein
MKPKTIVKTLVFMSFLAVVIFMTLKQYWCAVIFGFCAGFDCGCWVALNQFDKFMNEVKKQMEVLK